MFLQLLEPPSKSGRVLRLRRRHRLSRRHAGARRSGPLTGMTLIGDRPAAVLDRVEPGHRVGDLIMGAANRTAIVTLVERVSRCTRLGHLADGKHDAAAVRDAVIGALGDLPPQLRLTLTWDQGKEMALHPQIAQALGMVTVHCCDPHSPWQRARQRPAAGLLPQGRARTCRSTPPLTSLGSKPS